MAKSKRERRSSIRHMQTEDDLGAIFDALEKAEREDGAGRAVSGDEPVDADTTDASLERDTH